MIVAGPAKGNWSLSSYDLPLPLVRAKLVSSKTRA